MTRLSTVVEKKQLQNRADEISFSSAKNEEVAAVVNQYPKEYIWCMIAIGETLVSEEVIEKKFVCDLNACKGACCVKGDYGAPLEEDELAVFDKIYPKVKPYMTKEGIDAVEKQGRYLKYDTGEWVTPLNKGKECAYTYFDADSTAKCAVEKAYLEGKIDYKKPISCHLYPIRVNVQRNKLEAVNYDRWSICKPACKLGEQLQVPVYKFLKEPLTRKYGKKWYSALEKAAKLWEEKAK